MTRTSPLARRAFVVNAVVAWTGVGLTVLLSAVGAYRDVPPDHGLYGDTGAGLAGAMSRLTDTLSYFTIWSNIVVALSLTLLARDPRDDSPVRRILRLDALLMILVTAIVYQVVLAPTADVQGWSRLTDPLLHVVTPVLTVLVWLVWGPRGWITGRLVPAALVVPGLWIVWMLVRGAVVDAYPYGFVNVVVEGYGSVAVNLAAVLAFALVVAAVLWGIDRSLTRRQAPPRTDPSPAEAA